MSARTLLQLDSVHDRVIACTRCGRLRSYCEDVGIKRRAAYREWDYWTKPVPGFGDPRARLWIIGLAPGAHGANRTGRIFTGDRSGDFLYAALHRTGFANQPTSVSREDGLRLADCYISATARCAPPDNKPSPAEIEACAPFLDEEWRLLTRKRVILALGKIAWDASVRVARRALSPAPGTPGEGSSATGSCSQVRKNPHPNPLPSEWERGFNRRAEFAHGSIMPLARSLTLIGSYHVSQQNTFTGRLTPAMFDDVLARCRAAFAAAAGKNSIVSARSRRRLAAG
jgi:uracil-DNA glycosylase family 4